MVSHLRRNTSDSQGKVEPEHDKSHSFGLSGLGPELAPIWGRVQLLGRFPPGGFRVWVSGLVGPQNWGLGFRALRFLCPNLPPSPEAELKHGRIAMLFGRISHGVAGSRLCGDSVISRCWG